MALLVLRAYPISLGWQIFGLAIFLFCVLASVYDLTELQQTINEAITESMALAKFTPKQAASVCGMSETNFYRALSGEENRHLSLARLFCFPYQFWVYFGPMLMWLVAKKHAEEIAETVGLRRRA